MLKIRLMRIGAKQKPFYRVVVVDERSKRSGAYIELLGTYNPLTEPKEIKLKQDRIDHWIKQGAQLSTGYLRIIGKAPQRPPRKAKKPARNASDSVAGGESKQATGDSGQVKQETAPVEEKPAEPAEEVKAEEPVKSESTVIPSDSEESLTNVSSDPPASLPAGRQGAGDSSATPQNDNDKESENKNEGSA